MGFNVSTQVYLMALTAVGYQALLFHLLAKLYARHEGFTLPRSARFERVAGRATLESGALVGALLFLVGLVIGIVQFCVWAASGFGPQDVTDTVRLAIPAALLMILGVQTIMAAFFLGILSIPVRRR